ncbi:MAG: hypothetical protein ACRDT4_18995 [Micromonosporaceae bacterium]
MTPSPHTASYASRPGWRRTALAACTVIIAATLVAVSLAASPAHANHSCTSSTSGNWLTDPGCADDAYTLTYNYVTISGSRMYVQLRYGQYRHPTRGWVKYVWARHAGCCGSGRYIELRVTERYTNDLVGRSYRYIPTRSYSAGYQTTNTHYNYNACIYRLNSLNQRVYSVCTGASGIED